MERSKLEITSTPDGAEIYVDDAFVGNTPSLLKLQEGKHKIRLTKEGFKNWERELTVAGGSELKIAATLDKGSSDIR